MRADIDVTYLKAESYRLIGAAFEVYDDRGHRLAEEIYQECLEIELKLQAIPFRAKQELACFYKGHELQRRCVPDLKHKRFILSEYLPT